MKAMNEEVHVGTAAPDFTLPDQNGNKHTLSGYRGRWVFLYFYPRDNTPECTEEACAVRDHFSEFQRFGVSVLGVSPDDIPSHKRFADKYHLPFALLADIHKKVAKAYGAIIKHDFSGGREGWLMRISFLIDLMGEIEKKYDDVRPTFQIKKVLADLEQVRNWDFA